ncbi:hypothetical protein ACWDWS_36820 [Streptomyces sp. NPDC003328]|uniref:Lipoprotein n=1 Tax=Streptomyces lannensis TaxID=766498 RepID=A0ABP7K0Q7_9ACTN|nr:hypothetical protein [Streptomyces sp. WAC07094]
MATHSTAVTAAVAAGAALMATVITYASVASVPLAAAAAQRAAVASAAAPESDDKGDNGYGDNRHGDGDGRDNGDTDHGRSLDGWDFYGGDPEAVHVNERDYAAVPYGCITVVSGLGSKTLNVRNDSKETVEVFSGATCGDGAPIATVGPFSSTNGLFPRHVRGGVEVEDGVVGSFRVVRERVLVEREDHYYSDYDYDEGGR